MTAQSHSQETAVMTVKGNRILHLHPEDSPQVRSEVNWANYAVPFIYSRLGGTPSWASRERNKWSPGYSCLRALTCPPHYCLHPIIHILTKRASSWFILLLALWSIRTDHLYICVPLYVWLPHCLLPPLNYKLLKGRWLVSLAQHCIPQCLQQCLAHSKCWANILGLSD